MNESPSETRERNVQDIAFSGFQIDRPVADGLAKLVEQIVCVEIAKERAERIAQGEQLQREVGAVSVQVEERIRELAARIDMPSVQYVSRISVSAAEDTRRVPRPMLVFSAVGLACSVAFGCLLALSALGRQVIHPFISLIGMVGGLGWVATAWADLLSLGRRGEIGRAGSKTNKHRVGTIQAR
jgi:hypothetical protein